MRDDARDRQPSKLARIVSAACERALVVGVGQQHDELLAAPAAGEVAGAHAAAQRRAEGLEHLVAGLVAVAVVERLEVVEVEHDAPTAACRCACDWATIRISASWTERRVGEPGQRVGRRAVLGDREVAQVGEDRGGLRDRHDDPLALDRLDRAVLERRAASR